MEVWMPTTDPYCIVKRLLLDRLFFAPGFLLIFYFVMNILEVGHLRDCPSLITSVEKAPCRFWYIAPAHAPVSHNNKTHWEVKWITLIILSQSIVLQGRNWFQAFMWKPFDTHHPPKHRCRSCTASPGGGGRGGGTAIWERCCHVKWHPHEWSLMSQTTSVVSSSNLSPFFMTCKHFKIHKCGIYWFLCCRAKRENLWACGKKNKTYGLWDEGTGSTKILSFLISFGKMPEIRSAVTTGLRN